MLTCIDCHNPITDTGEAEIKCKNCGSYTEINRENGIRLLVYYKRADALQIFKKVIGYKFEEGMRRFTRRLGMDRALGNINESKYS